MSTQDSDRLLLEYLDGTATPAERARMDAALAANPSLRARHDQLASLFRTLSRVGASPAPADLRDRVLREIRERPANWKPSPVVHTTRRFGRLAGFGPRQRIVVGLSFAAGLALGALAMAPARVGLPESPDPGANLLGSMGGAHVAETRAETQLPDARMSGAAHEAEGGWRVVIDLDLPEGGEAELSDPTTGRVPVAVRRIRGRSGNVRVEPSRAVWSGPASGRFELEFAPLDGSTALQLALTTTAGSSQAQLPLQESSRRP